MMSKLNARVVSTDSDVVLSLIGATHQLPVPTINWVRRRLAEAGQVFLYNQSVVSPLPGSVDTLFVTSPPVLSEMADLIAGLSDDGLLVILGAEDQSYDTLKEQLIDHGVIGADLAAGESMLWWGGRKAPQPAGDNRKLPLITSFYTRNTPYETEMRRLVATLDQFGLEYDIRGVEHQGSWEKNCAYKAEFIRDIWRAHQTPVIWLDADATLHARPDLLAVEEIDFAINKYNRWQFASGTVYFGVSAATEALLDRWVKRCHANPRIWDQLHLDFAWADVAAVMPLRTLWLPSGYYKIFDKTYGHDQSPLVIEHHQASRRFKKLLSVEHVGKPEVSEAHKRARVNSRTDFYPLPE